MARMDQLAQPDHRVQQEQMEVMEQQVQLVRKVLLAMTVQMEPLAPRVLKVQQELMEVTELPDRLGHREWPEQTEVMARPGQRVRKEILPQMTKRSLGMEGLIRFQLITEIRSFYLLAVVL